MVVEINGVELNYEMAGDGEPLLWLHGFMGAGPDWKYIFREAPAGYRLIVVTNQPDVARGLLSRETVDAMHARLAELLPLDDIRVCPHDDADGCECRKPKPGMLVEAAREHGIALEQSFMVGDRRNDVEAGRAAGCTCVFLDRKYSERMPDRPDIVVRDLGEAVAWILSQTDR